METLAKSSLKKLGLFLVFFHLNCAAALFDDQPTRFYFVNVHDPRLTYMVPEEKRSVFNVSNSVGDLIGHVLPQSLFHQLPHLTSGL